MSSIEINGIVDTFYKKNVISFSNEKDTRLNSKIKALNLANVININLDLKFLHPSVFNQTKQILIISGSLNSIDGEIFISLKT